MGSGELKFNERTNTRTRSADSERWRPVFGEAVMNNVLLTVWMERQTHWIAIKTLLIVVSVGSGGKSSR